MTISMDVQSVAADTEAAGNVRRNVRMHQRSSKNPRLTFNDMGCGRLSLSETT